MAGFDKDDILFDISSDLPSAYKEKKWGKEEGGENITHGYSLRGKHAFKKAVVGLKENFKKGFSSDIDGNKFRVLDT